MVNLMLVVLCLLLGSPSLSVPVDGSDKDSIRETTTPRFIVKLTDGTLLCFGIDGYELFTYSLISTPNFAVNTFVNASVQSGERVRGSTDIGMVVKITDQRVSSGTRLFKAIVDGVTKKARISGFGQVDMRHGSVTFSLSDGHSNIESQDSVFEEFQIVLDKPKVDIRAVSPDGHFFDVYVKDATGLIDTNTHGLIGQFFSSGVYMDKANRELVLGKSAPIPMTEGKVWDGIEVEEVKGEQCWYPREGSTVIQGHPYDYIVEHVLSTAFKYSHFS